VPASRAQGLSPELIAERRGDAHVELDLRVPADLVVFPGHFPGFPVVPGVLQLDWVLRAARERLGFAAPPARIEMLKFKALLRPDQRFTLRIDADADRRAAEFALTGDGATFSSGRVFWDGDAR
jgi:3-hydroxymyristoyl/3-hydroxydecanoyl-(acyl carrier protein) dehydratase